MYSSSGSLRCGLALMAWPAQRFEIAVVVCAAVSFRLYVVHRLSGCIPSIPQAFLAKVFISFENDLAQPVPLAAVTTLMAALTLLVLLPALISMLLTVA